MISIVDYGVGNLKSLKNALEFLEIPCKLISSAAEIATAEKLLLPGVGAFAYAVENLHIFDLKAPIIEGAKNGVPILGICLGMQLLFTDSEEGGGKSGLDLIPGHVKQLVGNVKVPHVGWNEINSTRPSKLFKGLPPTRFAYFVHSYYCEPESKETVTATTEYGTSFPCVTEQDNVFGVQFHPEKSQELGLELLKNFSDL
ncbi:MAG: imidazole glycerol phosphate synthase subunit HisH [bacterium]